MAWVWLELLGAREKPITSWFKTASNWHKMRLFSPFCTTPSASHWWIVMAGVFPWPPRVKLPQNRWWELGIGGSVRCPWREPKVKDDLRQRSGRSCYDRHTVLFCRCWMRLDGSWKHQRVVQGAHFTPSCVVSAPSWSCTVMYVLLVFVFFGSNLYWYSHVSLYWVPTWSRITKKA